MTSNPFKPVSLAVLLGAWLWVTTPFTAAFAQDAGNPAAYALRFPLTVVPGAAVQQLQLPAQALAALQNASQFDVRVFNAQGQAVPLARAPAPRLDVGKQLTALSIYPLRGPASAAGRAGASTLDGMTLRIEEQGADGKSRRAVTVTTTSPVTSTATEPTAPTQTLGALLDARQMRVAATSLAMDADFPAGQPITLSVAASRDLKTWRPLGDVVAYRADPSDAAASSNRLGSTQLDFPATDLKGHYLRVTWADATGRLAAVQLRGATLTSVTAAAAQSRLSASLVVPALTEPHVLGFSLPFATPVAALQIKPQGSNVLIPLRVLGRADASQPWQLLGTGVAYRLQSAGKLQLSQPIELQRANVRELRLEADRKTTGFSALPDVELQFEPVNLVFVANGPGPFTLAVGLDKAPDMYLPLGSVLPAASLALQEMADALASLPVAVAATPSDGRRLAINATALSQQPSQQKVVLWAVLVVGLMVLGFMAWVLLRQVRAAGKPPAMPEPSD